MDNEKKCPEDTLYFAKEHFLSGLRSIRNSAVLLRKTAGEEYETVFVSDEFAQMMGCTPEETCELLSGSGFVTAVHPDEAEAVRKMLANRVNEEGGSVINVHYTTASDRVIRCSVSFSFIDDFGENYVYCTFHNVTLMKEYEERLRLSYTNLGDSFYNKSSSTLGRFRVNLTRDVVEDTRGKDLYDTDSAAGSYTEMMKERAGNYPIPEERVIFLTAFDRKKLITDYFDGRTQSSQILYSRRPDGRYCYVVISTAITRHPMTGDVIAFISEDMSNSRKVNDTLLDKILVRQFDMVAYIVNGQYGVIIGDAELIGHGSIFPATKTGQYRHYIESQVIPVLSGNEEQKAAMANELMPETIKKNLDKSEPYFVNIVCDIDGGTYYKRFDFYKADPASEFYILLKSDTTQIHIEQFRRNAQLREALEEARQANVAKTAFLSRMSHEIRTPMNAIIGIDNIALCEPNIPQTIRDHLVRIGGSARYLLSLINDILDMSRIESGKMVLKTEEFSFSSFLDQLNIMVSSQCRDKGLDYECHIIGKAADYYIGDDTKLKQVLVNILGNAVKFTEVGGVVTLSVERINMYGEHSTFRFTVRDTGIGMDKEYLPKIFEAFSQEDSSTTSSYGGSGLGMAITKNLVEMMNGSITVDSEKNKGTVFTVEVSLRNSDRSDMNGERSELDLGSLRVLIIDEDKDSGEHSREIFSESGIAADTVKTGKEAIDVLTLRHARRDGYNLFIADPMLHDMDGIRVIRSIRKIVGDSAVILLSGYDHSEYEKEALEAGADGFVGKPLFVSGVLNEYLRASENRNIKKAALAKKPVTLDGKRILVAEDVFINAQIVKRLLKMKNMEFVHAENGQFAVDLFAESPENYFDAVLMDVRMPVMDGLTAAKSIRELDREDCKTVPIIAMTANAFDEDVQRSLQAGMNAHLTKPVDPDVLYKTLIGFIFN